ncbi:hypothetical protein [Streptomyces sp. AN091965]|uniref:hypothetical protein n=1 Tax=Streptomyces sp. AN091965 TaxID=2927803 RepID=UPI001F606412|nr:hypothetical protein [Streptomyces sp. AN091965]MCI3930199.1 hypothetical protein [Streptomyces sp. AN091965]
MTEPPVKVVGRLVVDLGEGREDRTRWQRLIYSRQPRAFYECFRPGCTRRIEGPVSGPEEVKAFVATARAEHVNLLHGGVS